MAPLLDRAYIPSLGLSDLKDTSTHLRPCIVSRTLTHRYDCLGHSFACIVLYHVAYSSTPRNNSLPEDFVIAGAWALLVRLLLLSTITTGEVARCCPEKTQTIV